MEKILGYGVILSFIFASFALTILIKQSLSFGKKSLFAEPGGDWKKGVAYAFAKGMMPWEKESARKHILTYLAGFLYHFGIFSGLIALFVSVFSIPIPPPLLLFLQILIGSGLICGAGLFIKRIFMGYMRQISCPDDFLANIIVDAFLLFSFLNISAPGYRTVLYTSAILMFVYMPLGKIRHCIFFFYSRILFGCFFGRRGVFPNKGPQIES